MPKILVITYPNMALGYRLAGVDVIQVVEGDDYVEIMNKALKIEDLGILAVEDAILNKLPESFVKRIGKAAMPLIVPVSTPAKWKGEKKGESYISRLIRRAIGYQIKIKR